MANKKGPLDEIEKFFITNNYNTMSATEMSIKMRRTKSVIEDFMRDELRVNLPHDQRTMRIDGSDLFAHHEGSTVMTQAASEFSDESKKGFKKPDGRPSRKCVTTIKKKS